MIKHYKGVCHVYVDGAADLKMAEEIVMNAKVQRPAVCNAMETLLVDQSTLAFIPRIAAKLSERNVELRTDSTTLGLLNSQPSTLNPQRRLRAATEQDWFTEYNDYILNVRVVDGVTAPSRTSIITARPTPTAL